MGGYGSGWYRPHKTPVEWCYAKVSADALRRQLLNQRSDLRRTYQATLKIGSDAENLHLVEFRWQPHPVYRQGRLFLLCFGCRRQVGVLYMPVLGSSLQCRRCNRLTYASQRHNYPSWGWFARVLHKALA